MRIIKYTFLILLSLSSSCDNSNNPESNPEPHLVTLNNLLDQPWGMDFLPDGRILVSQRGGSMLILSPDGAHIMTTVTGIPSIHYNAQGGLLDVAVDPDFDITPWVYWSYTELDHATSFTGTAVARGQLINGNLSNVSVIYRQLPKVASDAHYGSRLAFANDKTLFVTFGDRRNRDFVQDLSNSIGKIIRINRDGSGASQNPIYNVTNALPEIWSYGHRNPQGAAIHPETLDLWVSEHGPQGGDEVNHILPGANYGWPIKSYGCEYSSPVGDDCRIGGGTHAPDYTEPVSFWVPTSVAPAGISFYTGDDFPEWKGDLFIAALADKALWRVSLSENSESQRERLFGELNERIRDVNQGPDGRLYLLTDTGKLIQINPDDTF